MPTPFPRQAPATRSRCFIALGPDAPTRAWLAELGAGLPPARLHPADLHLTVAFLGTLTADHEAHLHAALTPMAHRLPDLALTSLELWPHPARPRVAVAGFALPDPLRQLVGATRALLRDMALPVEGRPFRPHVTLARFKPGQPAPALPAPAGPFPSARFDTLGLYCTAAPGTGVRYQALFRLDLH
ncbi:MAG: RNA 2',3'-cyclic phosphodiesterase [Pigmentiphaga sp.]|uniref:RNA 2',3'-cyclic phosphodiesterase n=1 Tax=Pigmentiphaga sp. TaxID=1977564 RepID=UPI0029ABBB35|nr:RNA 2',3'-cyclic phosphodiesterase [Pigmentiphaga sp.]MDX3907426.1 RNA 2',3'-cyclic phosphodiesterase [Pigmentiphaga sp.]